MDKQKYFKTTMAYGRLILYITIILILISINLINLLHNDNKSSDKKEEVVCIEMDAIVSYSCKDYTVFSTAEFSNFIVFDEPTREFYAPVVVTINTNNTPNTLDDEVVKVKDRDPETMNSTGGDIYEQ